VLIPGFQHTLTFFSERMSLGVGICVCAVLGGARPRQFERWGLAALALVFFGFLFRDERALNAFEDRMQDRVAQLPPYQKVVLAVADPSLRVDPLTHMIDRVCVGRCFSYANYEPSTAQFRVRAVKPNRIVAATYVDSWLLQTGNYVVRPSDVPMYSVDLDVRGNLTIRDLKAGVPCGATYWKILPDLLPES
jgi:hypothetical protein